MQGLMELEVSQDAKILAEALVTHGSLPPKAKIDAFHVAVAAVNGINYLLTWNSRILQMQSCAPESKRYAACRGLNHRLFVLHPSYSRANTMWHDPIVNETRKLRESYAAEHNNDLDAIYKDIKKRQTESKREKISLPSRKPVQKPDVA